MSCCSDCGGSTTHPALAAREWGKQCAGSGVAPFWREAIGLQLANNVLDGNRPGPDPAWEALSAQFALGGALNSAFSTRSRPIVSEQVEGASPRGFALLTPEPPPAPPTGPHPKDRPTLPGHEEDEKEDEQEAPKIESEGVTVQPQPTPAGGTTVKEQGCCCVIDSLRYRWFYGGFRDVKSVRYYLFTFDVEVEAHWERAAAGKKEECRLSWEETATVGYDVPTNDDYEEIRKVLGSRALPSRQKHRGNDKGLEVGNWVEAGFDFHSKAEPKKGLSSWTADNRKITGASCDELIARGKRKYYFLDIAARPARDTFKIKVVVQSGCESTRKKARVETFSQSVEVTTQNPARVTPPFQPASKGNFPPFKSVSPQPEFRMALRPWR